MSLIDLEELVPEAPHGTTLASLQAYVARRLTLDHLSAMREAILIAHSNYMPETVKEHGRAGAVLRFIRSMRAGNFAITFPDSLWDAVVDLKQADARELNTFINKTFNASLQSR